MNKFKVFYSWQSDLPKDQTRNFIRKCIDEAIDLAEESEAIEAVRDEATTGVTGSPNIVTTLFDKIDDCDLFIADISLCFAEIQNNKKKSPNPNVMLELGYAVKRLGFWIDDIITAQQNSFDADTLDGCLHFVCNLITGWNGHKASGDLNNPKQKGGLPSINIPFAYPHLYLENLILPGGIKTCEPQKETREQFRYSAAHH